MKTAAQKDAFRKPRTRVRLRWRGGRLNNALVAVGGLLGTVAFTAKADPTALGPLSAHAPEIAFYGMLGAGIVNLFVGLFKREPAPHRDGP